MTYESPLSVHSHFYGTTPTKGCRDSRLTRLGTWLRIAQFFTLLPLGSAINRVPPNCFQSGVVVKDSKGGSRNLVVLPRLATRQLYLLLSMQNSVYRSTLQHFPPKVLLTTLKVSACLRQDLSPSNGDSTRFPKWPEYTLSIIRLIRPSYDTHNHLLSEPFPYSYHNDIRTSFVGS
jgi:hypothetical protein